MEKAGRPTSEIANLVNDRNGVDTIDQKARARMYKRLGCTMQNKQNTGIIRAAADVGARPLWELVPQED